MMDPSASPRADLAEWDVRIGEIVAPHGLDGALRIRPLTDFPERFRDLEEVCAIFPSGARRLERVCHVEIDSRRVRLRLAGVQSITEAEAFRGAFLAVRRDMRVDLPEDTYFVDDLLGLRVITTAGQELGAIREVLHLPANDVYVCDNALIPAIEDVVAEVRLDDGVVLVHPIEGLAPELGI